MAKHAKVKSGAKKRFRKTGSGIIKFRRADRAHGNTKVAGKLVLKRRKNASVPTSEANRVERMLGEK